MKKVESVSVVISAYNEERRTAGRLQKVCRYLDTVAEDWEVIVVDDGSSDATYRIVAEFAKWCSKVHILKNEINRGKGYSVKKGVLKGRGEYILSSDADLSAPIQEMEKLLRYLSEGYDIAIGSRGLPESDIRIHQPWYREGMGKIFNILVQLIALF
jgi:dolichyl-phosphate beta-glucosyltransferase